MLAQDLAAHVYFLAGGLVEDEVWEGGGVGDAVVDHGFGEVVSRGDEGAGEPNGILCSPGGGMAAENPGTERHSDSCRGARCWWSC